MKIVIIGKFRWLHDEEYIARSFESLGHEVFRIEQNISALGLLSCMNKYKPNVLLFSKWVIPMEMRKNIEQMQRDGLKTVCWLNDLYYNYSREHLIKIAPYFKSDYVFSTDGGEHAWEGVNHKCVRQGIWKGECLLYPFEPAKNDVVFVGSDSPIYPERRKRFDFVSRHFRAKWYGRKNTNEKRGLALNELYAETKIIIGDSFYSPNYWSNRIVETLGRGGFLIHQEVEGLKEEYPFLVTYKRDDMEDLKEKIQYYLEHEDERREIVRRNFEWVRNNHTADKKCQQILDSIK